MADEKKSLRDELKWSQLRANMWPLPLSLGDVDKEQALMDMLAGWSNFVDGQREDPEEDYESRDYTHEQRLADYPEHYAERLHDLYQCGGVMTLDDGELESMTPYDFMCRFVLPLFRE